jgi:predicted nucleic acid-binding protein
VTVLFDTNVYVSFIRDLRHSRELLQRGTRKYLSAVVLMELWAGAKARRGQRAVERLQQPYASANRIITLRPSQYIAIGRFFSALPRRHAGLTRHAGFLNDVQIAFTAVYLGAVLCTEDRSHFAIIRDQLPQLQVRYLDVEPR